MPALTRREEVVGEADDLFGSVEEVRRRYRERYIPGQQLYLATAEPERWASVVVDNDDPVGPIIEVSACEEWP